MTPPTGRDHISARRSWRRDFSRRRASARSECPRDRPMKTSTRSARGTRVERATRRSSVITTTWATTSIGSCSDRPSSTRVRASSTTQWISTMPSAPSSTSRAESSGLPNDRDSGCSTWAVDGVRWSSTPRSTTAPGGRHHAQPGTGGVRARSRERGAPRRPDRYPSAGLPRSEGREFRRDLLDRNVRTRRLAEDGRVLPGAVRPAR